MHGRATTMKTATLVAVAGLAVGCSSEALTPLSRYAGDSMWLCLPGMANDQCLNANLDATEILPDSSLSVAAHKPAEAPAYDCFYVYPTVNLTLAPGNHTDFSDLTPMLTALYSQAARFTSLCRVVAPLYRQATIGVFISPDAQPYLDFAYKDIAEAFQYYLDHVAGGRNLVIMGHSQGAFMTRRLIQEFVEPDPALRARLIAALLIGGDVTVKQGEVEGGSFEQIPLCTSADETGCILAYRSYAKDFPPEESPFTKVLALDGSLDAACVHPGAQGGGAASFRKTFIPVQDELFGSFFDPGVPVETPFLFYRDFYAGECVQDAQGISYMQVSNTPAPNDQRQDLIPYGQGLFSPGPPFGLGLHILDYNLALGDLMDAVAHKAQLMEPQ